MTVRRLWPVLALAALLGLANLFATPAFWPVDETSHVAYADHVIRTGRLPEITTPIPVGTSYPGLPQRLAWERDQHREGRQDIWTSNHPPLPYLVQGTALALGRVVGDDRLAFGLARLTSVAWLVLGVWATTRLAFLLAPVAGPSRRSRLDPPDVAYAAGALVAVTPTLAHLSGLVFNDVPAFTMSTLCLLAGARAAFAGVTPRRLATMGLLGGAAALTRVSCLPAVGVMVLMGLYGWWRDPVAFRQPGRVRTAVLAGTAFVPAAAFWLRNVVLYGDATAARELLDKFDRDLNDPLDVLLVDPAFWLRLWNRMWADLTTGHWAVGMRADITEAVLLLVVLATGVAAWRAVAHLRDLPRRRRAAMRRSTRRRSTPLDPARLIATAASDGRRPHLADDRGEAGLPDAVTMPDWTRRAPWMRSLARSLVAHPRRVVWALAALLPSALLASAIQFHSAGGSLHGRYLLGGHAVAAIAFVLVLDGIPRMGRLLAVGVSVPIFVVNVGLVRSLTIHRDTTWDRTGIHLVLPSPGGAAGDAIAVTLLAVAAALLLGILVQHRRPRRRGGSAPRPGGRHGMPLPIRAMRESAAR